MIERNKIHNGNALEILKTFPDESISMCVTSPPYYNLRTYHADGQIGIEKTPEEYTERLVEVFREVKRVLRNDGVFWLNLGDSYASGKGTCFNPGGNERSFHKSVKDGGNMPLDRGNKSTLKKSGLKPKDLIEIPSQVALALRSDGWWLRSRIPWLKRNSMPSSVSDRPSCAVEYVFMLTKSPQYYYDTYAVRTAPKASSLARINQTTFSEQKGGDKDYKKTVRQDMSARTTVENFAANPGRNRRDSDSFFESWQGLYEVDDEPLGLIVNPKGNKYVHFATFPSKLIEPLIKSSTSEFGYCPGCGAPYKRIIKKGEPDEAWKAECGADANGEYAGKSEKWLKQDELGKNTYTGFNARWRKTQQNASDVKRRILAGMCGSTTVGWEQTCTCKLKPNQKPVRGIVLDPFMGSGTTALVATQFGHDYIGIDLNPDYVKIAEKRVSELIRG